MAKQEKKFSGEIGIHYPLHVLNRYSLPELIGLAETAWRTMGQFGFSQVWTNDNLEYRSVLASSAAIVARLPVKLGTAVTVPYFRNPVDLAMAFATISELMDGREISLGLGPGSRSILTHQVERLNRSRSWQSWPRHYGRYSPVRRSRAARFPFSRLIFT
jgi:Coenzyme F420-dependent N5,N10-methylene tetrahydromethanopterin reductase and related flavin-dependent oxidoreductases